MNAVQTAVISHQQLWKTRSAPSRSPRAVIIAISLPATDPKPKFEICRYDGTAVTIIHSPYSGTPQKCRNTGTCTSCTIVPASFDTQLERKPRMSRRLVDASMNVNESIL